MKLTQRALLNSLTVALLVCAVAFIPAYAQTDNLSKTTKPSKQRTKAKPQVSYSCPMHPDVKGKKPGRCPKCGMDLRAVSHEEATAENVLAAHDAVASTPNDTTSGQLSKMQIPDLELLDQNGRKINFYTDLVKGRTVAINFIFTTCTTICPPLGATFARVQKELGDKAGRDVRLISVSVDPATDTPERLKAWGAKFHAGDGWTLVTGSKPQVDELLRALGASSARREDHTPTILIGNDASGTWTRSYGLAKASQLVQIITDVMAGRSATTTVETSN